MKKGINPFRQDSSVATAAAAPIAQIERKMVVTATGEEANTGFRNSGGAVFNGNGEINAWSKKDALRQIQSIAKAVGDNTISRRAQFTGQLADRNARNAVVQAAMHDTSGRTWTSIGASIAQAIESQAERESFVPKLGKYHPLNPGDVARVPVPNHAALAVIATSIANVEFQEIRQKVFTPTEFPIVANLRVANLELAQLGGDALEGLYNQGVEAISVKRDQVWKNAADGSVNAPNPLQVISGALTPAVLAAGAVGVRSNNLPVTSMVMASNLWTDILSNSAFYDLFDPVTKYDLIMNGVIGTLFGAEIITDGFRSPNQRVLADGEMYWVAAPEYHGVYTDRGGIIPTPVEGAVTGSASKGFFLEENFSWTLANPASVSKAYRV